MAPWSGVKHSTTEPLCSLTHTVNVLKFQTLFSFCSLIKCCLSGQELTKCLSKKANGEDSDQTASEAG